MRLIFKIYKLSSYKNVSTVSINNKVLHSDLVRINSDKGYNQLRSNPGLFGALASGRHVFKAMSSRLLHILCQIQIGAENLQTGRFLAPGKMLFPHNFFFVIFSV